MLTNFTLFNATYYLQNILHLIEMLVSITFLYSWYQVPMKDNLGKKYFLIEIDVIKYD